MKLKFLSLAALGLSLAPTQAGTISLSSPLTTDASSGISSSNTYTHAVSGGLPATVNGVVFADQSPASNLANFTWISSGGKNEIENNRNTWNPAAGGVTGAGLLSLLDSFTYAGGGAAAGSTQRFSLLGLSIGQTYDTRVYIRMWDTGGSGRTIDFSMSHGAEVNTFSGPEDRPGAVLGTGNNDQAYYVNYRFTALATTLNIDANVPAGAPLNSGSFHMFGITNQVVPEPSSVTLTLALGLLGIMRRRRSS